MFGKKYTLKIHSITFNKRVGLTPKGTVVLFMLRILLVHVLGCEIPQGRSTKKNFRYEIHSPASPHFILKPVVSVHKGKHERN